MDFDSFMASCLSVSKEQLKPSEQKNSLPDFFNSCLGVDELCKVQDCPPMSNATSTYASAKSGTSRIFTWRKKQTNRVLSDRYLAESYVAKLVGCIRTYLEDYDGGKKPICNERCSFGCRCQAFFRNQMEVVREDMIEWWGEHADSTLRRGLLYEDIKLGTEVAEDGTLKPQRWFIRNKQVCRNFYMRARGAQKETVQRLVEEISNGCSYLGATFDRKENPERPSPKKEDITSWLDTFLKGVGEKLPNEEVTVVPYNDIKSLYEEYTGDCEAVVAVYGKPASYSHFCDTFNVESHRLKLRLTRESGSFVVCPCCNSYKISLRRAKTLQERA